ncbi:MAG TPA: pilin [Candidatus Paceibacterota bacterium]|jgi:hypothetical protein
MKNLSKILLYIGVIGLFLNPLAVLAQKEYTLLEPGFVGGAPDADTSVSFVDYAENAYKIFLTIVVFVTVLMFIIGGLEYMTSALPAAKSNGIKRITAAFWGLILALSSVLILNIINPDLLEIRVDFARVATNISEEPNTGGENPTDPNNPPSDDDPPPIIDNITPCSNSGAHIGSACVEPGTGLGQGQYGEVPLDEFEVRRILESKGIGINDGNSKFVDSEGNEISLGGDNTCTSQSNVSRCRTYIGSLSNSQIQGIINLKENCNCEVMITGGAEQGAHSAGSDHYDGAAVDIRSNGSNSYSNLDAYVQQNRSQFQFVNDERSSANHWHIEF